LLAGKNPYTLTFPNIYGDSSAFYGPGMSVDNRLQFGFPYPPLSLLLAVPGAILGGDFRYSQLIALAAGGALIALARGGRMGLAAAALYMFSPRGFFVLEQGWTEPYVVALLALVVFCACRFRAGLGVALGLLLASKQYMILALALVPLLQPLGPNRRPRWRWIAALAIPAIAVATIVTMPLALWDLPAFIHSVVALQFHQPFRADALSFLAAFAYVTGGHLPGGCGFVAATLATLLALRRCRCTPAGFSAATAFVFFSFFAFNKQAFCNYYSFVVGALCVALGAWRQGGAGSNVPE
jgi:4-amino-4-deoxy-L-arabinose transferase-like glycosyltransferase